MTARQQLDSYLSQIERRLRIRTTLRGAAILALSALLTTCVLVVIANALAFSGASVISARIILYLVIAACIAFGGAAPLMRLNRRRSAWEAEAAVDVALDDRPGDDDRRGFLRDRSDEIHWPRANSGEPDLHG